MVEDFCDVSGALLRKIIPSVSTMIPATAIAPEKKNSVFALVPQRFFGETNSRYLLLFDEFERRASASLQMEDIFAFVWILMWLYLMSNLLLNEQIRRLIRQV